MKIINNIISFFIVLFVGSSVSSKFSYNLSIRNGDKKWFTFIQHPIKYIINKGKLEQTFKEVLGDNYSQQTKPNGQLIPKSVDTELSSRHNSERDKTADSLRGKELK